LSDIEREQNSSILNGTEQNQTEVERVYYHRKTNEGNDKGLHPSVLVHILTTHNNETPFKHIETKKIKK